jgi:hypothetical protein
MVILLKVNLLFTVLTAISSYLTWSLTGKLVALLCFGDSLHKRRNLVVRHPDLNCIHPRLNQWPSAVVVNLVWIYCAIGQRVFGGEGSYEVREPAATYGPDFNPKNGSMVENT